MAEQEAKGADFEKAAEKKMRGWAFFGYKYDDAADLFVKAANAYKLGKCWDKAGSVCIKRANCHLKLESKHEAASAYVDAANCYKKINSEEAITCLNLAVNLLMEIGRLSMAAKHYKEIGEIYENGQDVEKAMEFFERAADLFQGEEVTSTANQCRLKVAQFAAQLELYPKAIELFESARKKKAESNEKPDLNASEVNLGDNVTKSSSAEKRGRKKKGIASVEAFLDTSLHNLISETEAGDSTLNQVSQTGKGPTPANFEPVAAESNNDIHFDGSDDKEPQLAVVEEEDEEWVDDEDVEDRWKVRASDFFKEPLISNVVGEDGTLIDWEGEADNCIIQEICNMEWDDMAFHPTPLVVLVFERYTRICDNWKALKELEKAFQVYWESHNKLPPRTVKIDAKIEKDLASALRVKDTPEILFIRGGKLLYRETEVRTANELVQMIAHFYYNAKRPTWLRDLTRMPDKA